MRERVALHAGVRAPVRRPAPPWRRRAAVAEVERHFASARFPFRHDRELPRTIVRGDPGDCGLDPSFRAGLEWPFEAKQELIDLGYELTSRALRERS